MKADKIVKKQIVNLPVYETGKPIEYVAREFGLDPDGILKMASNEIRSELLRKRWKPSKTTSAD